MQKYSVVHPFPFPDTILLPISLLLSGAAVGVAYYVISEFIYFHILSPLAMVLLAGFCYHKIINYIRVPNKFYNVLCGLLMGVMIVIFYHYATYYMATKQIVSYLQTTYPGATEQNVRKYIDRVYLLKTGSTGLLGYLIFTAQQGKDYTLSGISNGMVYHTIDFSLKGTILWLYWVLEAGIIIVGIPYLLSRDVRFYNDQERDWYATFPKRIGNVEISNQDEFISFLKADKIKEATDLLISPEQTQHPTIEVNQYSLEHHSHSYKLLEVIKTRRIDSRNVHRVVLFRTEIPITQYTYFAKALKQ